MSATHILIVDDEPDIRNLISDILQDEGYSVAIAANGEEANMQLNSKTPQLILLDIWMPDIDGISLMKSWMENDLVQAPIVMMSGHGTVETAVEATRLGAKDFIEKPLSLAKLLQTVTDTLEKYKTEDKSMRSAMSVPQEPIGSSAATRQLLDSLSPIYKSKSHVLIYGQSGVGKTSVASLIHQRRLGLEAPLVSLDCSQLKDEELEEQLCAANSGVFAQARSGHLLISNLELSTPRQQSLLKTTLKSGQYQNQNGRNQVEFQCLTQLLGDESSLPEEFDKELIQLLSQVKIYVPSLAERAEDIPELLNHYVNTLPDDENTPYRKISFAVQNRLRHQTWKNNLTELKNTVRQLLMNGKEGEVELQEVEDLLQSRIQEANTQMESMDTQWFSMPLREAREAFEKAYLIHHLKTVDGRVGELAKIAGMERTHLYRKLRALNINPKNIDEDS